MRRLCWISCTLALLLFARAPCADTLTDGPSEDAKQYVQFVEDLAGNCTSRNAKQVLVRSTHPLRKIRVWLDRYHMGTGTGDRSRTELLPDAEPEPLGCARSFDGPQEWRIVRAEFFE